jgi:PAS domain S-box-containing protein
VNPACVRILGFRSPEEIIGKHPAELSAPVQLTGERAEVLAKQSIEECLKRGSARFDWVCRNPRGQDIPIEVILTRIEWGGRQLIQAVINDISERKRAEAELLKTVAREKELGLLRSKFVSMVSHEFRTPLGIIQSSAEILEDYLDRLEPDERREHLRSIRKNTQRMAGLMEEVLLLGGFDAGRMEFKPAPLDLRRLARQLVDEVLSATQHRCPIQLRLGKMPATAQADERLLRHIITNLLTNAVKYSAPNQPVRFEIARDGANAVCRIRDEGIGIPEADREWVFDAFHRGRNVGDRPGSGLGLVVAKRCADLHRGRIEVDSSPGAGTTMTVRLPVFEDTPARRAPTRRPVAVAAD